MDTTEGALCPVPTAEPPLSCSVPVQFTPYNSLKVFDISKHTGTVGQQMWLARATEAVIVFAWALCRGAI